jgi:hypothetical protein
MYIVQETVYNNDDDEVIRISTYERLQRITMVKGEIVLIMSKDMAQGCALALDHAVARLEDTQFSIEYDQKQRELLDREGTKE